MVAGLFQIIDHVTPEPAPPSIPAIAVKLSNSSQKVADVLARGDFYLWLPGPDAQHAVGKYELRTVDGNAIDNYQVRVRPGATVTVYARILNQEQYGRLLEQNEYDITLQVRRASGELETTEDLPFTRAAIGKYYLAVDVGPS
ncbi:hypothetical protein GBA63_08915 [Rubrobacter tropicus]|uniref:Uncharacterized protein n=1 Tax=Rubrobacter tropicus TaxID=2653851 RepID=A0A6G8Q8E2_9ACTN|nr:hypothetical protein [Rubrobacter tropicus]QIN82754.1 hypothetical protein GBA63_08915 [Rubrobacter tropicus]